MEGRTVLPNIDRDEVLRIVKRQGPLIPNQIKQILKVGDTILLGAMLSELASKGQVKISSTKIGGSPFYYDPSNPRSLEKAAEHLNEKDVRTYKLLKEKKVLRDDREEALIRVSLRNIKDFAKPLQINASEGTVLFWKYYLIEDDEAEVLIKKALGMKKEAAPKPVKIEKPQEIRQTTPVKEEQQTITTNAEKLDDEFYKKVRNFFDRQNITIKEQKIIRKNSEIDFVITMNTPVGSVDYYCKAKSKKKSNDGDLASAKLQGTGKNLPVIYLTTGEVTKKAMEKLEQEFKGLVLKRL